MTRFACGFLAAILAASAQAAPLEAQRFKIVLDLAREYAADRTLIFYCLRKDTEQLPYLWYAMHAHLADAMKHLQLFSDDPLQHAELSHTVLANVRAAAPDANDSDLDAQCKSKNVEKAVAEFSGVGTPLVLRPPFDRIGR